MPRKELQPSKNAELNLPLNRIYGRRYCGNCEYSKPLETGKVVDQRADRWLCKDCLEARNVPKQETT
jgi:hypothetical protein